MNKQEKESILASVAAALDAADREVSAVMTEADRYIAPVRRSVFKRFPTMFLLAVTFGVSATVYGFERLIAMVPYLHDRPILILVVGILVLIVTGQLYKKLG